MATMTLMWNPARLHLIGAGGAKDKEHGSLDLKPGVNIVDRKLWETIRANRIPVIEHYIDEGEIEELEQSDEDRKVQLPEDQKLATKLIRECHDKKQLDVWFAAESRQKLKDLMVKRFADLEKRTGPTEESPS